MAYHFSANQYENRFTPPRLNNWETPHYHPFRPRHRKGSTRVLVDDAGHLLPGVKKLNDNPWGYYRSTHEFPERVTTRFVEDYDECLGQRIKSLDFPKWRGQACFERHKRGMPACETKCVTLAKVTRDGKTKVRPVNSYPKCPSAYKKCPKSKKFNEFEYTPGDFTPAQQQHGSRQLLLEQKYARDADVDVDADLPLSKLYLRDHDCGTAAERSGASNVCVPAVPLAARFQSDIPDPFSEPERTDDLLARLESGTKMPFSAQHSITEKPHERCPSPIIPAYANFELAKRMHNENLDHQPLPDCVSDRAYRKLQLTGGHPGLALDIDHIATGVGVKTHNAGPTHCTKMKIYRPKTCGVVPTGASAADAYRFAASAEPGKKMGAMDLAIRWDYRPSNPADEPERPKHIDGSNDSTGPAVFTCVKTPRESSANLGTGRSAGVFTNTLGETGFFDKDIMRRKTDFGGRRIERDADCGCGDDAYASDPPPPRARSVTRDFSPAVAMPSRFGAQYQSSPNIVSTQQYRKLRDKYLGVDAALPCDVEPTTGCKRANAGFFRRARTRLCHKVAPEPALCCRGPSYERHMLPCRPAAFRAGLPKFNAAGHFVSSDSGCSMGSNHGNRVLVVPRPRIPYAKRNYDIDTLVPPFTSFGGGAGEGGYPEHWRLASVYQHAYKPLEQRRTPLLHTVYK